MFKTILLALVLQTQQMDTIPLIDSDKILEQSSTLINEEKYKASIALLRQVAPHDSNYVQVQNVLMSSLTKDERISEAKQLGQVLIDTRKDASDVSYITLGNLYLNNGDPEKGIEIYTRGRQYFPYSNALIYNLGYAHYLLKAYDKAVPLLQEVLTVNPYYRSAHSLLGNIMAKTNQRTKAALCYWTYLMIDGDQNWALVRLNNLMNDAYREEGTLSLELDNSSFETYDALLRSKVVFDDRYKTTIDFEAPVVQQTELLMSKLRYLPGTEDFWMNFYVPLYERIYKEGLMEPFVFYMLYSSGSEKVVEYLEKNTKAKEKWIDLASDMLRQNRLVNKRTVLGKTEKYSHWYFDDGTLNAIGAEINGNNTGPYYFYHENGRLQAAGEYNNDGSKIGKWQFYHENGQLSSEQDFSDEGLPLGEVNRYSAEGDLVETGRYKEGNLDGSYEWYYPCGTLKETYPYVEGVGSGEGIVYYETGEVWTRYGVKDSKLNGDYTTYFQNGEVKSRYTNKDDEATGPFVGYYPNGQMEKEGRYEKDLTAGAWLFYFKNGQLSDSGNYVDNTRIGKWIHYYQNGKVRQTENYNDEGQTNGTVVWYDLDGKIYSKREYRLDTLVAYKFFDKYGKLLYEQSDVSGNMPYKGYFPSGQLEIETTLVGGKYNGLYKEYHINGRVEQEGVMNDNLWNGAYRKWSDHGNMESETTYVNGTNTGYFRSFYESGQLKTQGWMQDDVPNQLWKEYYPDGTIGATYQYDAGKLTGPTKYFDSNGRLYSEEIYDRDQLQLIKRYDTLEQVFQELTYANNETMELKSVSGEVIMVNTKTCGQDMHGIVSFYPGGVKKFEYTMVNSSTTGYKSYTPDGKLNVEGDYLINQVNNEWKYYNYDGVLQSIDPIELGVTEGPHRFFYDNGTMKSECFYLNGERHGPCKYYDPSGALQVLKHYKTGYGVVGYQYELKDGTLSDTVFLNQAEKQELRAYYSTGEVSLVQEYDHGNFEGVNTTYFKNGEKQRHAEYRNGNTVVQREYYPNSQLERETPFVEDLTHGTEKHYYPNGKIRESVSWRFGNKDGWHRFYGEDGQLKYEYFYRYGQLY